MEIPSPDVVEPVDALRDLIAQEETQTVLAALRRQSHKDGVFSEVTLAGVTDEAQARLYLMNLGGAVRAYRGNRDLLKTRFTESRARGSSLVDSTLPAMASYHEAQQRSEQPLYTVTYNFVEIDELAKRVAVDPGESDKVLQDFGAPAGTNLDPLGALQRYTMTWDEVVKCRGVFQVYHPLVYAQEYALFGAELTRSSYLNTRIIGVSEYGKDITHRIILAHKRVAESIDAAKSDFAQWEDTDIGDTQKLSRSMSRRNVPEEQLISQLTMYEGSLSILQSLSMMLAEKVEGYDNGDDLVTDIIESGLLSRFARKVPYAGIVGPLATAGLSFKNLLVNEDGKLAINPELEKALTESKRKMREQVMTSYGSLDGYDSDYRFMSFNGCPIAHDFEGGENRLQRVSELFLEAFKATA